MNRNWKEIKEEIVNEFILRSMMAYPSDKVILPLIFHLNISNLNEEKSIQQWNNQIIKCRLCGSFFNPYCQINENSVNWKCSICNSINQLPLPPSDSIFTAYSVARKSICYNNAVFDFIPSHLPIKNNHKPKIIISIQNSIYNDVKNILSTLSEENDLFSYSLTVFDSALQLFNFHSKTWHIISDIEDDGIFFFPTNKEFLFGSFHDTQKVFTTEDCFSSNNQCNIENICKFVSNFQNAKLLLILSGPITSSIPSISFPVSVIFYKSKNFNLMENFHQWSNNASSSFYKFDYTEVFNINQADVSQKKPFVKLVYFLSKSLFLPFKSNISIRLHAPKLFNINQEKNDFHIFTLARHQSSIAQILSFAQFEISFNDCMNDGLLTYRYINVKIPLSPDPRIFRSSTFPNLLRHLSVAASLIVARLREILFFENETITLKITNQIMEFAFQFPLVNFFWPHFVHELIFSDILQKTKNLSEISLILLILKNLPPQITLLHFLPFQFVNGNLLPLYPKANKDAVARVTEDEILIINDQKQNSKEIAKNICQLLDIDEWMLPVVEVASFEEFRDDEIEFNQWKHDFELSSFKFLEEKRKKRK